ncbi:hypothetical protein N1028_09040 [Herbiconiux sp. CPCC 203407]|uniref:Tat (Twin-arginine translocation) pathway signal sequence n=1 Tax=Herbiconiux oxytropis TaxID=2970915 RepID=A0AA41XD56_9MICO|nr:hypothetical protein [Herbiconiux oxytropis]MCS5720466.1 hypothetical protein [Herbiconiux oxytropis]MCS5726039.1 hypothetical protein [Herbiconiux oxytropis]
MNSEINPGENTRTERSDPGRLRSWPAIIGLLAATVALVTGFVIAPVALLRGSYGAYTEPAALENSVATALDEYWRAGEKGFPALLSELMSYWFQWHLIKVVITALLITVIAMMSIALWQRYLRARKGAAGLLVAATGAMIVGSLVVVVLLANVQSAAAPLVSLLQVLPGSGAETTIAPTIDSIVAAALDPTNPSGESPVLTVLLAEITRYHGALAVGAFAVAGVTCAGSVTCWRRRSLSGGSSARTRRMLAAVGVFLALLAVAAVTISAVSALSALEPGLAIADIL